MDLLLLSDGSVHYFVLINDLIKLVNFIRKRAPKDMNEICLRCFYTCSSLEVLHRHRAICYQRGGVQITILDADNDQHIFKNIKARWFVPRVLYFDLVSLTLPVSGAEPDPEKLNTQIIEKHQYCGYGLAVLDIGKPDVTKFELKRGPDCTESLLQSLETLAKENLRREKTALCVQGKMQNKKRRRYTVLDL